MLVDDLYDKTECVIHMIQMRNLKQALNHGLILKKVHTVIKFNQKAWLKPYIDMRKTFSSWWITQFLEKLWKIWEDREILNLWQQKKEEIV